MNNNIQINFFDSTPFVNSYSVQKLNVEFITEENHGWLRIR